MIVGIVGKYESDSRLFYEYNKTLKDNFVKIDSDVLSKVMGIGDIVHCTKKSVLLKKLESIWGNVCVVGNLFIDDEVQAGIINSGGKVFIVQLPYKGIEDRKWDSPKIKISNSTILVFDLKAEEDLKKWISIENRKDGINMTIEESIKKAMAELGIKPNNEEKPLEENNAPKTEEVEHNEGESEVERNPIKLPESPDNQIENDIEISPEVYLKIKDGKIALFIPEGVKFNTKTISDKNYSVLVFKAPDLGNTGLQPLNIEKSEV